MNEDVKKEISEAAVKLAEYIHENKFEGLMVSGGSNQLSRSLFTLAWQDRFKGEKMPEIYVFDQEANRMLYKSGLETDELEPKILDWIATNLPKLEKIKDHNICYVDDFAITGDKYSIIKERLKQLEFKNLKFAFFAATIITDLDKGVFVGTLNTDSVRELQSLSLKIQGRTSIPELLEQIESRIRITAKEHRAQALKSLREIGQQIRLK